MHGFTDIILTPHYITNYYETPGNEIELLKDSLKQLIKEQRINVNIHSGMEIYISEELDNLVKNGTVIGLANSKYLLIEFPLNTTPKYIDEVLFVMQGMGYQVIIAHPERYKAVQEDVEYAVQLVEKGCLLQSNFGSIIGIYGKHAKKTIKKLLNMDLVTYLASDVHREETIYKNMPQIIKKLKKVISEEKLNELTTKNPKKIIEQ